MNERRGDDAPARADNEVQPPKTVVDFRTDKTHGAWLLDQWAMMRHSSSRADAPGPSESIAARTRRRSDDQRRGGCPFSVRSLAAGLTSARNAGHQALPPYEKLGYRRVGRKKLDDFALVLYKRP